MSKKPFLTLVISAALLAAGTVARASDPDNGSAWNYEGAIYLWGAGIGGKTAANEDIDIAFKDLWDNLDMAFMGTLSARKGRWSLLGDVIYMDVSGGKSKTIEIGDRPVPVSVGVDMESWIILGGAGYTVHESDATSLALMGGARYLWLELGFDRRIGPIESSESDSGDVVDAVVGLRGRTALSDRWYLSYHADIGTGQSDLTWQAIAGLNYRFKHVDAGFGYRYLAWDFDDGEPLDELDISGPYAGVRFRF